MVGQITAIQEKQYDDAFTLQYVEPELVEIFHYMAGMVPFIQKLVTDVSHSSVFVMPAWCPSYRTGH